MSAAGETGNDGARAAIIVFAKAPVAGHAKTRLIPALGASGAARLASRMLDHAAAAACEAALGPVELCATPDAADPAFTTLVRRHGITLAYQGEGSLGTRMHRALSRVLATCRPALLMGTDAPQLDAAMLRQAARRLEDHDAVFVPARDGGYVLVGLHRPHPELFAAIAWSTPTVMGATRDRAQSLGLRMHELPAIPDVDEPDDLAFVPQTWLREASTS